MSPTLPGFHKVILCSKDKAVGSDNDRAIFNQVRLPELFKHQTGVVVQSFVVEDTDNGELNNMTYNIRIPQFVCPYSYTTRSGSLTDCLLVTSGYNYQAPPTTNDAGFHTMLDPTALTTKSLQVIIDSDTNDSFAFANDWVLVLAFYECEKKNESLSQR